MFLRLCWKWLRPGEFHSLSVRSARDAECRIKSMGIEDIVKVVEHDFTADSVFAHLPAAGSVDVITMSYSYSMIPNKAGALLNASKLIKPAAKNGNPTEGGLIMVADFFAKGRYDDCLPYSARIFRQFESEFHKWWFAHDSVFLLTEKELDLASHLLENCWDDRFRGSVPFLPFLKPYHGVYVYKRK